MATASKVQDVDDVPRRAGEDADVNAIYESWKENNAGEFGEVDCVSNRPGGSD